MVKNILDDLPKIYIQNTCSSFYNNDIIESIIHIYIFILSKAGVAKKVCQNYLIRECYKTHVIFMLPYKKSCHLKEKYIDLF